MAQTWRSYSDFYRNSPYGGFPQEHRMSCGRNRFNMIMVDQKPHNFSDPAVNETIIAITLAADREYDWRWRIGAEHFGHRAYKDEVIVVPSQMASDWTVDAERQLLILTVPDSIMQNILKTGSQVKVRKALRGLTGQILMDQFINVSMLRLWQTLGSASAMEHKLADSLLTALVAHLLIQASDSAQQSEQIVLPSWRLRNVERYVESRLDENITMQELADAAGLSVRHFARSFRCELGMTPHRWLMDARLERARSMLVQTDDPLCQVARACGFSSQSHLTTLMKQRFGMTPFRVRLEERT